MAGEEWIGRFSEPQLWKTKLKLDLHTHCYEATNYHAPTVDIVRDIVARMKDRGLDGMAITEHMNKTYSYKVKAMAEELFGDEVLIIPGQEIDIGMRQEVELYLPGDRAFRFLAHPGYPGRVEITDGIRGIEIQNDLHDWHINKLMVRELAQTNDLLLLSNSDAHQLEKIGVYYNEIPLDELFARSRPLHTRMG